VQVAAGTASASLNKQETWMKNCPNNIPIWLWVSVN
jgi:hypothetical protein